MAKIGLVVIATGKYDRFIPPLFKSMKKHFMNNYEVSIFAFTDQNMPKKEGFDLTGVEHLGFYGERRGTYETNDKSLACIKSDEGVMYFAGGFNGGTSKAFLDTSATIKDRVDKDLENDIAALRHDESHIQ